MRKIIVHVTQHDSRAAILEDERLVEFYVQKLDDEQLAGNIYLGKVVNVLPGMQAAFVDIGLDRNAFLYVDDAVPSKKQEERGKKVLPTIKEVLQVGQEVLVQVKKESFGNKGPRVTSHISIPGRYLVYIPDGDYIGVSRKIESEEERNRLKTIGESLKQANDGMIIRTVAEGASEEQLKRDFQFLRMIWTKVLEQSWKSHSPMLLYKDLDLVPRLVRDLLSEDVVQFMIDDGFQYRKIREMIQYSAPELTERLYLYTEKESVFDAFHITAEIEKAMKRKVWLKSGGYLIIDRTEALTSIDVNTGKYIGHTNLEETVLKTNMEAAVEIARQLRLRDIGGIIIIDFIDMVQEEHREKTLHILQEEMKKDRTKSNILGYTQLGLVEMTRKKVRQNLESTLLRTCPMCDGIGKVISEEEMSRKIEKELVTYQDYTTIQSLLVEAHPYVTSYLIGINGENLHRLEKQLGMKVQVKGNPAFHLHQFEIHHKVD
ncbi:ribonuclease E/G [Tepidibacillus infernus]|uniref:Ribonuclease G n=1 Tax=Tepidibacillus decaturensis TaxID=1413211 RepID=A0A135L276_9BACI|nr:Rne/Rng family ribonuclease [Tepidibacillus decaturensis]KXG43066.1 hypothetical protein U473_02770 [Tepidibacillus decaturensis]